MLRQKCSRMGPVSELGSQKYLPWERVTVQEMLRAVIQLSGKRKISLLCESALSFSEHVSVYSHIQAFLSSFFKIKNFWKAILRAMFWVSSLGIPSFLWMSTDFVQQAVLSRWLTPKAPSLWTLKPQIPPATYPGLTTRTAFVLSAI